MLSGASLEVKQGTFHILLGPNGCGKSTLLRVLGGLLQSDSGSFQLAGPVGFVFQNPDHQVVMPTVAADVAFGLGRSVKSLCAKASAVVQLTGAMCPCLPCMLRTRGLASLSPACQSDTNQTQLDAARNTNIVVLDMSCVQRRPSVSPLSCQSCRNNSVNSLSSSKSSTVLRI